MSYPDDYTILERIKKKLDAHDKSLFTAFELNLLRDIINYHLSKNSG